MRMVGPMRGARAALLVGCVAVFGCPDDDDDDAPSGCADFDVDACTPLYGPTFEAVYTETLQPRCSVAGASCHANPDALGAARGFWFDTPERAHMVLLEDREGGAWVRPGDVECSPLMGRLNSDDPLFVMPPGSQPMPLGVRCSVGRWIAEGAAP